MRKLTQVQNELEALADPAQAVALSRFFKTGKGEYGEGDRFRGIKVPQLRALASRYGELTINDLEPLITSGWHEDRLFALLCLVQLYRKGNMAAQKTIYEYYMAHTAYINNWDLVDLSAEHIPGAYLFNRSHDPIFERAGSVLLWDRRIALLSTFYFIKQREFGDTLRLAALYCGDKEDLIHKATGWMLREIGKRDMQTLERFLRDTLRRLPRTTLRYAIERFPENKRRAYLNGTILQER